MDETSAKVPMRERERETKDKLYYTAQKGKTSQQLNLHIEYPFYCSADLHCIFELYTAIHVHKHLCCAVPMARTRHIDKNQQCIAKTIIVIIIIIKKEEKETIPNASE